VAATVGNGFTESTNVAVLVQPAEVPLTVYVVVAAGATVTLLPEKLPGCQA
jgi:hypothetical protein